MINKIIEILIEMLYFLTPPSRPLIATSVCKCGWWIEAEYHYT